MLDQSYRNIERLVVDDASEDRIESVLERFDGFRLRFSRHEDNRDVSTAMNTVIEVARTVIIAFQDSDDEWLHGKLREQVDAVSGVLEDVAVVRGGTWRTRGGNRHYLPNPGVWHE